jgi:hypothetical protein
MQLVIIPALVGLSATLPVAASSRFLGLRLRLRRKHLAELAGPTAASRKVPQQSRDQQLKFRSSRKAQNNSRGANSHQVSTQRFAARSRFVQSALAIEGHGTDTLIGQAVVDTEH